MSQRTKSRKQAGLMLMLYNRPLHPELFRTHRSETADRRVYSADIHLVDGGHVVEFTAGDNHLTEVIVSGPENMPERGLIESVLCRGERTHDARPHPNMKYDLATQEEQLPATLYEATRREIKEYAQKRELMWIEVPPSDTRSGALSALDIERRANQLLVQSFHLFDDSMMVIKTQGIIAVEKTVA